MATSSEAASTPGDGLIDDPTPGGTENSANTERKASSTAGGQSKNRKGSTADTTDKNGKVAKRRAPRACASCRARKVRCDVVENFPCGNCRWDNVECIIQESRRRRRKDLPTAASSVGGSVGAMPGAEALHLHSGGANGAGPITIASADLRRPSNVSAASMPGLESVGGMFGSVDAQAPLMCKFCACFFQRPGLGNPSQLPWNPVQLFSNRSFGEPNAALGLLPPWVKPLPDRIGQDEVAYLQHKGALSIPEPALQNALLQAYVEYVHPYMPLLELFDFLNVIHAGHGQDGQISLLLYQAVLFAGSAFVKRSVLAKAGYPVRKVARKMFFQRARLLYDFDYDSNRLVLVQALLLMTYWYETPDDQKDTWHWMGVAISLAHTIGLHRNPDNNTMPPRRQRLWKRIWWSCFMRDRLIALGMRRPTRIKDEDFDVPMLHEGDFEIDVLPKGNDLLPPDCTVIRNTDMQRQLAEMCVQKAKLCVLISHMLKAQYSVLIRDRLESERTNTTMMLLPNKSLDNLGAVEQVDRELAAWATALPPSCQYRTLVPYDIQDGRSTIAVQRNLLHMVYQTTTSALHRPLFLPTSPLQPPQASRAVQEASRDKVKNAATQITRMAAEMYYYRLAKFLPTTGVTVVLPAMIIHLVEYKHPDFERRKEAQRGFHQCMQVMVKLREIYAAADFAAGFLESALKKAAIHDPDRMRGASEVASTAPTASTVVDMRIATPASPFARPATPPPDQAVPPVVTAAEMEASKYAYLAAAAASTTLPTNDELTQQQAPQSVTMGDSPPHSERDIGLTPSASGSSEHATADVEMTDINGMDWTNLGDTGAGMGNLNLDFDQWLHFPGEGMNNTDNFNMGLFDANTAFDNLVDTYPQP
ncbi:cutinase transcription factor 1 beta [Diaporthe helianthi]|uniref:Cutinase transcription factor 1 beta n=1 Tax=Diaporthe helianthi TaxID=158607 RepID=A0A2P5HMA1_DIAHE|nr:cutinase transcription factor 1 beta [Diaporthe helianthi]